MKYYRLFFGISILIALALPLFHMNTAEITEQENRTLAKFPKMRKKGKLNTNYGKEFESWLGDRFWGRDQLIDTRFQALYKINGRIENDKAFIGDDGWMFEKSKIVNRPSIEKQRIKIEKDAEILKKLNIWAEKKHVRIFFITVPDRDILYQKYWERYYKPKPKLNYETELIRVCKDLNIKIISLTKDFELEKNKVLFFKDDGHVNFLGESILCEKVYNTFNFLLLPPEVRWKINYTIEPLRHNKRHSYSRALGLHKNYLEEDTFFIKNIKFIPDQNFEIYQEDIKSNGIWAGLEITKNSTPVLEENLYVIGGCYMYGVNRIFSPIFRKTFYFRTNDWDDDKKIRKQEEYFEKYLKKIKSGDVLLIGDRSTLSHRYIKKLLEL